ncbi:hypothetical protein [Priestia filamentosa]|uniref:hypothetical protein n=1 Tax=Priestia filamentosa TaxID=1402861 RepID=UPI00037138C3|nr:hypothetical protein [Priestia filamentosa]
MIKRKLREMYENVDVVGFYTSIDWDNDFNYKFYLSFNDTDTYNRVGSIFAFLGMLMNWFYKSSFAFYPDTGKRFEDCYHQIDCYIQAFLKHSNTIKKDFPIIHSSISYLLCELDTEETFENRFPHIDKKLFQHMRETLCFNQKHTLDFDKAFEEVRLVSKNEI